MPRYLTLSLLVSIALVSPAHGEVTPNIEGYLQREADATEQKIEDLENLIASFPHRVREVQRDDRLDRKKRIEKARELRREVDKARQQIRRFKEGDATVAPWINIVSDPVSRGTMGRIRLYKRLPVHHYRGGHTGDVTILVRDVRKPRALQIVDAENMLVRFRWRAARQDGGSRYSDPIWIEGMDTDDVGEDEVIDVTDTIFMFVGYKDYVSVAGSPRRVLHFRKVDIERIKGEHLSNQRNTSPESP